MRKERSERRKLGSLGLAELIVREKAELIIGAYLRAIEAGDWRASESLLTRVFGRPQEKLEVSQPQTIEEVEQMTLAEIRHLRSVVERSPNESSS